jgi:hypothetical protein
MAVAVAVADRNNKDNIITEVNVSKRVSEGVR